MTTSSPTGFSADEVTASVEKLVLSSIRRPYDTLGTRRTDVSFNDVQEAAAGVFLLVSSAPFYIASLGTQRLVELVQAETLLVDSLLEAIAATGRKVFPIKDLTTLGNASAALFELEAAVGARSQGFKNIEGVPAYQRFKSNLDQFLGTAGQNIKQGGVIVQTPQEARGDIPALVGVLQASHQELVRRTGLLAGAMDDYSKVNLPSLAAAGVISKARQVLQQHMSTLEGLSETERLAVIRPIVLDLLSSKAVVAKYGSFSPPSAYLSLTGTATPYSDASHPALPGGPISMQTAPYSVLSGANVLDVWLDAPAVAKLSDTMDSVAQYFAAGPQLLPFKALFNRAAGSFITDGIAVNDVLYVFGGPNSSTRWQITNVAANQLQAIGTAMVVPDGPTGAQIWRTPSESIPFGLSYVAAADGAAREPFDVPVFPAPPTQVSFFVGAAQIVTTLTPAAGQSAQDICNTLNGAIVAFGQSGFIVAEPFLSPIKYDGVFDLVVVAGTGTFTLQSGQLDGHGLVVGDQLQVMSGTFVTQVATITAVDPSVPSLFVQATLGAIPNETGIRLQLGPAGRKVRLRLLDTAAAVPAQRTLTIDGNPTYSVGTALLGWLGGSVFTCRPNLGKEIVADYNSKAQKSQAAVVVQAVTNAALGRTKPEDNSKVVIYRFAGVGDVTGAFNALTLLVPGGGLLAAGVVVGDTLVLRTSSNPDSIWTITSVSDTGISTTGVITPPSEAGVSFEIGPSLSIQPGMLFRIASGPDAGDYYVQSALPIPFEMKLTATLPSYKDGFSQPVLFPALLGRELVQVLSKNTTTSSRATLFGAAATLFNTSTPFSGKGTTVWFKLPSIPTELRAGDFLDIFISSYKTPDISISIVSVDPTLKLIELASSLDSVEAILPFGDTPPPFARLRSGRVFDFSSLQTALNIWAARPENQDSFFVDLNRFLNPLLVSENPTDAQLNDAKNKLLALLGFLSLNGAATASTDPALTLEAILDGYKVDPIEDVDTLIKSYKEKGSDRAIDLLTEGQFTTFFGLTVDGASYAGSMQESMRALAMNDLPMRKSNRDDANSSKLLATADTPDPEYDQSDIDDVAIDPPPEAFDRNT